MLKAMIVDDHPLTRTTAKNILKNEQFETVAQTGSGTEAVPLARAHKPDLILLDIAMPSQNGLAILAKLCALTPTLKVIVLTSLCPTLYSRRCIKAGAAAYVAKTSNLNELVRAISVVMSGYTFFPNLAIDSARRSDIWLSEQELVDRLTERELAIFRQLSKGLTHKQISEDMQLSNKTINTYKARVLEKLNLSSLVHLTEMAKRNGWI